MVFLLAFITFKVFIALRDTLQNITKSLPLSKDANYHGAWSTVSLQLSPFALLLYFQHPLYYQSVTYSTAHSLQLQIMPLYGEPMISNLTVRLLMYTFSCSTFYMLSMSVACMDAFHKIFTVQHMSHAYHYCSDTKWTPYSFSFIQPDKS